MAIIVEEEKRNTASALSLLGWFVLIVVIAAGAYYLFFAAVEPAIVTPPAGFGDITPISQITVNPQAVVSSTAFSALKQTISEPSPTAPASVGRTDPFLAP
jgi:hypothetical protein